MVRNAEAAVEKTKLKARNGKLTAVTEVSNNVQPPTLPRRGWVASASCGAPSLPPSACPSLSERL